MIRNDDELSVTRAQLKLAEDSLISLQNEIRPKNQMLFALMAESHIELVQSLRAQIDEFLGVATIPEFADLAITLEGQKVGLGITSAGTVARFIDTFRRGLQTLVEVLNTESGEYKRRKPRWIEELCDLPIIGLSQGSVKILLGEPAPNHLFVDEQKKQFGDAINILFSSISWADTVNPANRESALDALDKQSRQRVLSLLASLLPPRSGNIERVVFSRYSDLDGKRSEQSSALTRSSRNRIFKELERLSPEAIFTEELGVIRSVDHDSQNLVLRERSENLPDLLCEYDIGLQETVKELLDLKVVVSGVISATPKSKNLKMFVEAIELYEDPSANGE